MQLRRFDMIDDDGAYFTILENGVRFTAYGSILADLANIHFHQIKEIISECPFFNENCSEKLEAMDNWMLDTFRKEFDPATGGVIYAAICSTFKKFLLDADAAIASLKNEDNNANFREREEVIFRDTVFDGYGDSNIGHILLSSLAGLIPGYILIRVAAKKLSEGENSLAQNSLLCEAMGETVVPCRYIYLFDEIRTVYVIDSLEAIALLELSKVFSNKIPIKCCENCGRFFVPAKRSDEIYCNNPAPQDNKKTCKQYGSEKLWYERLKNDEAAKLARNIYSAKRMLVTRNPDIEAYAKMFDYFKAERKKWESDVKSGIKTKDEYIRWLNEMKQKKTL